MANKSIADEFGQFTATTRPGSNADEFGQFVAENYGPKYEPVPTGMGAVKSKIAKYKNLRFRDVELPEEGITPGIDRPPDPGYLMGEAVRKLASAYKESLPEDKRTLKEIAHWVERDWANLPKFLSPTELLNFAADVVIKPKEVWGGVKQQFGTLEGWGQTPITNLIIAKGAQHGIKKVGKTAAGLEKLPWERFIKEKPAAVSEMQPLKGTGPAMIEAAIARKRGTYPPTFEELMGDITKRDVLPETPGVGLEGMLAGVEMPIKPPAGRVWPVAQDPIITPRPYGELPRNFPIDAYYRGIEIKPPLEGYLEGGILIETPQPPIVRGTRGTGKIELPESPKYKSAMEYYKSGAGRGIRVETSKFSTPEAYLEGGTAQGLRELGILKGERGGIEPELFVAPLKLLYRGSKGFYDWYFNPRKYSYPERLQWWDDHVVAKTLIPLPVSWYEQGPLTFRQWNVLEKTRQNLFANAQKNPEYLKTILGDDVNPELLYELVIKPSIERNGVEKMVMELGTAMEKTPLEIREHLGMMAEGKISKQEFVDRLGVVFGEMTGDKAKVALDLIVDWGNKLNEKGMLTEASRAKWENPYYLTRTYFAKQSLRAVKRSFDENYGPGIGDMVERVHQKNLVDRLDEFRDATPAMRERKLAALADTQAATDIKYILDHGIEEAARLASDAMKKTTIVDKMLGGIGISKRGMKINDSVLKARGIKKEVAANQLEKMKAQGFEVGKELSPGEYMIQPPKGSKSKPKIISGEELLNWMDEGWSVLKQTKQKRFEVWRDLTIKERSVLGEIKEIDYKIASTMMKVHNLLQNQHLLDVIAAPKNKWSVENPNPIAERIDALNKKIEKLKERPIEEAVFSTEGADLIKQRDLLTKKMDEINGILDNSRRYGVEWKTVPNSKHYGAMRERMTPDFIHRMITGDMENATNFSLTVARKYYGLWKKSKTIWNPATHVRNFMFNSILADLAGVDPLNPRDWQYYKIAKRELKKEFDSPGSSEFVAKVKGTGIDIFRSGYGKEFGEYMSILDKEMAKPGRAADQMYSGLEKFWNSTAGKADKKLTQYYALSETFFKAAIIAKRIYGPKAKTIKVDPWTDAAMDAQRYMFDYGNVSPVVDFMRRTPVVGSPFVTFHSKLVPLFAEAMVTRPTKVIKWMLISKAIQKFSQQYYGMTDEEANLTNEARPQWYRNSMLRTKSMMVPGVDRLVGDPGTVFSYDLGYLNPLADPLTILTSLIPMVNDPVFNAIYTQMSRKTSPLFSDKEIIDEGPPLQQPYFGQRAKMAAEQVLPIPAILTGGTSVGGKLYRAGEQMLTGESTPEWWGGTRHPALQIIDALGGQKIRPELPQEGFQGSIKYLEYKRNRLESERRRIASGQVKKLSSTAGGANRAGKKRIVALDLMIQRTNKELSEMKQASARLRELQAERFSR